MSYGGASPGDDVVVVWWSFPWCGGASPDTFQEERRERERERVADFVKGGLDENPKYQGTQ